MKPDLAIVLLNWNGRSLLEEFVPRLIEHTPSEDADLIVIDNGSTDDSLQWLASHAPSVRVVSLDRNLGFAGGYNVGLRQIDYRYYCLLNTDIEVSAHWIDRPLALLREGISAVQPKLLSYRNRTQFEYAGGAGGALDSLGYPFCRGRVFDTIESDTGQYDDESEIFWASGACFFVDREMFDRVGGFDESFFAHMEEIDLCWRIWLAGGSILYTPDSTVYHVGGATLHASNAQKTYLNFRNNLRMLYKNIPSRSRRGGVLLMRFFLDLLSAIVFLLQRKPRHAGAVLRAERDFYRDRRRLQQSWRSDWYQASTQAPISRISILWRYHVRRQRTYRELTLGR